MKKKTKEFCYILTVAAIYLLPLFILYTTTPYYGFGYINLTLTGLIIFVIGAVFWAWGFFSLGKLFNILPKPIEITKRGIYKYVNHPIYIGIVMVFSGLSISLGSYSGLLYSILILIPFNFLRTFLEEKYLRIKS